MLSFFLKKFVFVFVSDLIIPFLFIFSMSKAMDYTAIPEGNYDLTLMDVSGRVMRVPVIIQR